MHKRELQSVKINVARLLARGSLAECQLEYLAVWSEK